MDRFWKKVARSDTGCWEWLAVKNGKKGYGMFSRGAASEGRILAHRMSYQLTHGAIPRGMFVLHKCDNPGCVRPDHLFLGDHSANETDKHRKGRGRYGVTPDIAYAILWRGASKEPKARLAAEYGLSPTVVKKITQRVTWLFPSHD